MLAEAGIYCGIVLIPVLPFITDNRENMENIIRQGKEAGAKYIICQMGMTLREGQREYFYQQLEQRFPGFKEKYIQNYGDLYSCSVPNHKELWGFFTGLCQTEKIATKMNFYTENKPVQISLFD